MVPYFRSLLKATEHADVNNQAKHLTAQDYSCVVPECFKQDFGLITRLCQIDNKLEHPITSDGYDNFVKVQEVSSWSGKYEFMTSFVLNQHIPEKFIK